MYWVQWVVRQTRPGVRRELQVSSLMDITGPGSQTAVRAAAGVNLVTESGQTRKWRAVSEQKIDESPCSLRCCYVMRSGLTPRVTSERLLIQSRGARLNSRSPAALSGGPVGTQGCGPGGDCSSCYGLPVACTVPVGEGGRGVLKTESD